MDGGGESVGGGVGPPGGVAFDAGGEPLDGEPEPGAAPPVGAGKDAGEDEDGANAGQRATAAATRTPAQASAATTGTTRLHTMSISALPLLECSASPKRFRPFPKAIACPNALPARACTTLISRGAVGWDVEGGGPRSTLDRGFLAGLAGVLTLEAAGVTTQVVTGTPVPWVTVVAAAFVVVCMGRLHGAWGTMAFVALVVAIPFASEFVGVLTGIPYGAYAYSSLLGPRLFGLVPVFILAAWIHIGYLTIAATTLGFGRSSLWLAPIDGLLATAWDAMVDPLAVRAGFWTWQSPAGFYGVPLTNFLGWFLVVTLLSLVTRAVWARDLRAPALTPRIVDNVLPGLLLGTTLSFAVLAAAAGLVLAALVGIAVLVPAAAIAWRRIAHAPATRPIPNPWSAARHVPEKLTAAR